MTKKQKNPSAFDSPNSNPVAALLPPQSENSRPSPQPVAHGMMFQAGHGLPPPPPRQKHPPHHPAPPHRLDKSGTSNANAATYQCTQHGKHAGTWAGPCPSHHPPKCTSRSHTAPRSCAHPTCRRKWARKRPQKHPTRSSYRRRHPPEKC